MEIQKGTKLYDLLLEMAKEEGLDVSEVIDVSKESIHWSNGDGSRGPTGSYKFYVEAVNHHPKPERPANLKWFKKWFWSSDWSETKSVWFDTNDMLEYVILNKL